MKLLDRYVLRNFIEPFLLCFFGFLAIWMIFDLSDNVTDFLQAKASLKTVLAFYATQAPQIVLISLPVGLLLALLFSLSRMSRFNEIISMLTAGRSVTRLLLPLIVVAALISGALVALNYELAPKAEAVRKRALEQISRGRKQGEAEAVEGYLFRDRMNGRTWFIRKFRPNSSEANRLDGVHITQQDSAGRIVKKWYAATALYELRSRTWSLMRGMAVEFNEQGDEVKRDNFTSDFRVIKDWNETPWRIASSHQQPQNLTVPQLRDYLVYNSDFPAAQLAPYQTYLHHRFAFPMQCLVVVFLAGPLAIVFSRQGVVGGVAAAMLLYAGLLLSTYLFLALGKGARIDPILAAWIPNGFFFLLGLTLLYLRGSNREWPKFGFSRRKA